MWVADGSRDIKSKDFQNMRHLPLIKGDPGTLILDIFSPPELHLELGQFKKNLLKSYYSYSGVPDKLTSEIISDVFDTAQSGKDLMERFYKKVNMRFDVYLVNSKILEILV